jgi:hypothetical protein
LFAQFGRVGDAAAPGNLKCPFHDTRAIFRQIALIAVARGMKSFANRV